MNQCMKNLLFLHICLHLSDFPHLIPIKINVVYILHNVEEKIYVRFHQFTNYYINICNTQYKLESKKHNNLQLLPYAKFRCLSSTCFLLIFPIEVCFNMF